RRRLRRAPPQAGALPVQPALEAGGLRQVEARQQVAVVERERVRRPPLRERLLEFDDVATHRAGPELQRLLPHQPPLAERLSEVVYRLPERRAPARLVQLGPEQGDERVATVRAARRRERQVGEEG